jgi:F-type H+-transporting ATPase subunit b
MRSEKPTRRLRWLSLGVPALSLALVFVLGFARPAGAQEDLEDLLAELDDEDIARLAEEAPDEIAHLAKEIAVANEANKYDAECISILVEGGAVDDCQEAPNPLLPEIYELIWGAIGFLVVFGLLWKFGLPAIKSGMEARTERIRNDLQAAEQQRTEAESVLAQYQAQLNEARTDAGRIIEEARQVADQLRRDQEGSVQTELAEMRQRADAELEAARAQAMADLRGEVARLAVGAAETIVQRSLDEETHNRLVEDYIDRVAGSRS